MFQENEIKAIARILFDFKQNRRPGQHAMLKGREREGKTGALFSIALAAIILQHARRDPLRTEQSGTSRGHGEKDSSGWLWKILECTSHPGEKGDQDNDIPSSDVGQIFVAALGTLADLKKVKQFIQG